MKISTTAIQGESTFGMKENEDDEDDRVELQIRNATKILKNLLRDSGNSLVDLLHVNCEVNFMHCTYIVYQNVQGFHLYLPISQYN